MAGSVVVAELFVFQQRLQFEEVIFADILSGEKNEGSFVFVAEIFECIRQAFDNGFGTEVATSDSDNYDNFAALFQLLGCIFEIAEVLFADRRGEVEPSQEIVSFSGSFV